MSRAIHISSDHYKNNALASFGGWTQIERPSSGILIEHYKGYPPTGAIIGHKEYVPDFMSSRDNLALTEAKLFGGEIQRYFDLLKSFRSDLADENDRILSTLFTAPKIRAVALFHIISEKELDELGCIV